MDPRIRIRTKISWIRNTGDKGTILYAGPTYKNEDKNKYRKFADIQKSLMPPLLSFMTESDLSHLSWSQLWAGSRGEWRSGEYSGHSHPPAEQGTEKETKKVRLYQLIWKESE